MILFRTPTRALPLAFALGAAFAALPWGAWAQTTPAVATPEAPKVHHRAARPQHTAINPGLVLLDPAHGGLDAGAHLSGDQAEKTVTLEFAQHLRAALTAKGFQVQLTREGDPTAPVARTVSPGVDADGNPLPAPPPPPAQPGLLSADQRTEVANRLHPLACLILHATGTGHGVHLFTSALTPEVNSAAARQIPLWDTAQASVLAQSAQLQADLSQAMNTLRVPLLTGQISVAPIDSFACPALVVELAPWNGTSATDSGYQDRVASAVAEALLLWRSQTEARVQAEIAKEAAESPAAPTRPKPRTLLPNEPAPVRPPTGIKPPAPIVRRPAATAPSTGGPQ